MVHCLLYAACLVASLLLHSRRNPAASEIRPTPGRIRNPAETRSHPTGRQSPKILNKVPKYYTKCQKC